MKTHSADELFWCVVIDCLVKFHKFAKGEAETAVADYQRSLSCKVAKSVLGLIYHEEPFAIANEIAEKSIDVAKHRSAYEAILKDRGW